MEKSIRKGALSNKLEWFSTKIWRHIGKGTSRETRPNNERPKEEAKKYQAVEEHQVAQNQLISLQQGKEKTVLTLDKINAGVHS